MLRDKIIDVVALGLCTLATMAMLTACPSEKSSEETGPASGGTSEQAAGETGPGAEPEPTRPESMPMLCTLGAGKWCGAPCPKGDAGPLCCSADSCMPWDAAGPACDGLVGWCSNYTLFDDPKAEQVGLWGAACHDEI
jgi:hypothetical protein